jgi:hypothetical protein
MKRPVPVGDRKEKGRERKKYRSNYHDLPKAKNALLSTNHDLPKAKHESLFMIIPIEVIDLIVSSCGIVENHVLRFISKEFHRLSHTYGVIRDKGFWYESTCFYAAKCGYLEVLKWARNNGCPWNESTCCFAASNGQLEVLKWARNNGNPCPWGSSICANAALGGHLGTLKRYAQR